MIGIGAHGMISLSIFSPQRTHCDRKQSLEQERNREIDKQTRDKDKDQQRERRKIMASSNTRRYQAYSPGRREGEALAAPRRIGSPPPYKEPSASTSGSDNTPAHQDQAPAAPRRIGSPPPYKEPSASTSSESDNHPAYQDQAQLSEGEASSGSNGSRQRRAALKAVGRSVGRFISAPIRAARAKRREEKLAKLERKARVAQLRAEGMGFRSIEDLLSSESEVTTVPAHWVQTGYDADAGIRHYVDPETGGNYSVHRAE
ncbi:hypothetical protein SLS62_003625 [Diatrype stigma]|uniref:Uncharacterized protein n=1 Tax=Diatrype stigma TaxID=117547 RepID=A0AAN9UW04_9PEZI